MNEASQLLLQRAKRGIEGVASGIRHSQGPIRPSEIGTVTYVGEGVARVSGLSGAGSQELVTFPTGARGTVFSLAPDNIAIMLLDSSERVRVGQEVERTGRVVSVPVGESLLGRVVDPLARPLDDGGPVDAGAYREVEQPAPAIMDRKPVTRPLQTGIQAIDAMVPIGRGQRELIVGDRQTGKTAVAVDAMINQQDSHVLCVYCAVGQRSASIAHVISELRSHGVMEKTIVVAATEENPPGANFIAPYAATTMAESLAENGRDVLVVYDDLTRHARSYRELSLLLRRPPGREAYPGDIFYIHSRLLERATQFDDEHGGGSITALPVVETEEENVSAYIPTNLISITDGQIYLSPVLYSRGILPAIDIGTSVSRVGGSAQLDPYREVAGDLKLAYSQFEELESFSRFGVRLDEETRKTLARGERVRELLKQPQYQPLSVPDQIVALIAVNSGVLDEVPLSKIAAVKRQAQQTVTETMPDVREKLAAGQKLDEDEHERLVEKLREIVRSSEDDDGNEA